VNTVNPSPPDWIVELLLEELSNFPSP
jgi:hypothetical protein